MFRTALAAFGLATAIFSTISTAPNPAVAQKSKETLRMAINDMFPMLDPYVYPIDEAGVFYRAMFQTLVIYSEREKQYVSQIAKSWTIPQPGTYEFELRDDVTFHSGNKLTADDVAYTIDFFADPKVKMRFKSLYDWMKPVEKLGPNKVRITAKQPSTADLAMLARLRIFDSKIHAKLEKFDDYGRVSASGTGPYRLTSLERERVTVERRPDLNPNEPRAIVGRYVGVHMPDEQSQIAQLMTGGIDAIRNISSDNASNLAKNPQLTITNIASADIVYVTLDAAGRSKNKVMTDQRVRKAVMMAIDRDSLIKHIVPGHGSAVKLDAICFEFTIDCSWTTKAQGYDPAGAKKLLAEAGYPNGFDLQLDVHEPVREIGEAIAGDLRKVGIRASVQPLTLQVYVKKRGDGEFTMFTGAYPTAARPDAGNISDFFFGAERDYYQDKVILEANDAALAEFDAAKRQTLYRGIVDRTNEMNYILPISSLPTAYAMTKEVKINPNPYSLTGVYLQDLVWTDGPGK